MGNSKKKSKKHSKKNDDPKEGSGKDCCQICGRVILFVCALLAVIMSLMVVASCDFIEFYATNSTESPTTAVEFSFGQFRYDANNTGCRSMNDDNIKVDWTITTGRVSTAVALICAGVACLIILIEFLCCRFKFSRCLMTTLFSIAILGMAMAFLMFASDVCTSENQQGKRYPCKSGSGSWYAVAAIGLYFVTTISSCFAPRPVPMVRRLTDHDDNDPCLCCGGKKKEESDKEESDEEKDEEQPEPVPEPAPEPAPEPPPVEEDVAPVVVAAAAAPVAAAAVPVATQTSLREETEQATQTAPVQQVVTEDTHGEDVSQVSSIHPSGMSAVTMPTYRDVSIYGGDMFFDADDVGGDANSV